MHGGLIAAGPAQRDVAGGRHPAVVIESGLADLVAAAVRRHVGCVAPQYRNRREGVARAIEDRNLIDAGVAHHAASVHRGFTRPTDDRQFIGDGFGTHAGAVIAHQMRVHGRDPALVAQRRRVEDVGVVGDPLQPRRSAQDGDRTGTVTGTIDVGLLEVGDDGADGRWWRALVDNGQRRWLGRGRQLRHVQPLTHGDHVRVRQTVGRRQRVHRRTRPARDFRQRVAGLDSIGGPFRVGDRALRQDGRLRFVVDDLRVIAGIHLLWHAGAGGAWCGRRRRGRRGDDDRGRFGCRFCGRLAELATRRDEQRDQEDDSG